MKKKDLFVLLKGLREVSSYSGAKFAYAVAKNTSKILEECKLIEEIMKPTEDYTAYDQKRVDTCKQFADKDAEGNPVICDNEYIITENRAEFNKALVILAAENKEVLEARQNQVTDFSTLLEEESDLTFHKVAVDLLPEAVTAAQITAIMAIIED